MAWYAVYTKSRTEKKVALRLKEAGIEAYCPVNKREKQWSDRRKVTEEPLFRSYVFVNIDLEKQSATVRRTLGVVNFVYWLQKPAVIQDDEILAASKTSVVSMPIRSKIKESSLTKEILTSRWAFSIALLASATFNDEALCVPATIIDLYN